MLPFMNDISGMKLTSIVYNSDLQFYALQCDQSGREHRQLYKSGWS